MSDLTPDDENLLDLARGGLLPTETDRSRVNRKLLAQLGAGTTATFLSTSSAASSAAGLGGTLVTMKTVLVLIVSAGLIGGAVVVTRPSPRPPTLSSHTSIVDVPPSINASPAAPAVAQPPPLPSPVPTPVTPTAPLPATTPAAPQVQARASNVVTPVPPPAVTAPPEEPIAPVSPSAAPSLPAMSDVSEEARLLRRADETLRAGDAPQALSFLQSYEASFPNGVLAPEHEAERVEVLCALGRTAEARALGATFLRERPRSPLVARVRASCAGR